MGTPKERTMFSVMMENLKESDVIVKVTCENDDEPPGGVKLLYGAKSDTFYLPDVEMEHGPDTDLIDEDGMGPMTSYLVESYGEAWCQQSVKVHGGRVGSFSEARAASDIERKGWSFNDGKLLCPHCTKRKAKGGE